jgi:L-fuculose-phosphate aldolase
MDEINADTIDQLTDICHRLYDNGFVTATDGNVSVRLENKNFLTTRTGINKGMATADDIIEVDIEGAVVSGNYRPSTELAMHLFIYSQRPDIHAVVHAHPPYATGFATARQPLTSCLFPEVIVGLSTIPFAEYATPSTVEVIKSIEPFVRQADAILLANHGAVTCGKDLLDAYFKMEKVEHAAHITFVARMLGGEKYLTKKDVDKLKAVSVESREKDFTEKIACELADKNNLRVETEDSLKDFIRNFLNEE